MRYSIVFLAVVAVSSILCQDDVKSTITTKVTSKSEIVPLPAATTKVIEEAPAPGVKSSVISQHTESLPVNAAPIQTQAQAQVPGIESTVLTQKTAPVVRLSRGAETLIQKTEVIKPTPDHELGGAVAVEPVITKTDGDIIDTPVVSDPVATQTKTVIHTRARRTLGVYNGAG